MHYLGSLVVLEGFRLLECYRFNPDIIRANQHIQLRNQLRAVTGSKVWKFNEKTTFTLVHVKRKAVGTWMAHYSAVDSTHSQNIPGFISSST